MDFMGKKLEDIIVTLPYEDGTSMECGVYSYFEVNNKKYFALLPLKGEKELDFSKSYMLYEVEEDEENNPIVMYIEDDLEYAIAAQYFSNSFMNKYDFSILKQNLEAKGYTVSIFDDKETAANYLDNQINEKTVGLGGSVTIHEMNLFEMLSSHNEVYWHDKKPKNMSVMETRTAASRAEVYISSVNGISQKGEIVNIDNTGNRVAAISYGPSKIYLVIGSNKITPDLDGAIYRARNVASPLNAKRLNRKTPCAVKGDKCYDCSSPERICRNLSVLWDKPTGSEYEIVLIGEVLGY